MFSSAHMLLNKMTQLGCLLDNWKNRHSLTSKQQSA